MVIYALSKSCKHFQWNSLNSFCKYHCPLKSAVIGSTIAVRYLTDKISQSLHLLYTMHIYYCFFSITLSIFWKFPRKYFLTDILLASWGLNYVILVISEYSEERYLSFQGSVGTIVRCCFVIMYVLLSSIVSWSRKLSCRNE